MKIAAPLGAVAPVNGADKSAHGRCAMGRSSFVRPSGVVITVRVVPLFLIEHEDGTFGLYRIMGRSLRMVVKGLRRYGS